ncbi:unnamed protein product, partial [Hymenolepis diminuta]
MDRISQLKRAPIKLYNESRRIGILGYTIFKEAKDALNLSVLFYDRWKFELSSVEEEEYPKFAKIFNYTFTYKM